MQSTDSVLFGKQLFKSISIQSRILYFLVLWSTFTGRPAYAQWNTELIGDSLIQLIQSQPSDTHTIRFINGLAIAFSNRSVFDKADYLLSKSMELSRKPGLDRDLASTLQNMGVNQRNQGILNEAIATLLESLKIKEEIGMSPKSIAGTCNVLGTVYISMSDYVRGERYL